MKTERFKNNIGPGIIITAAFIGPGTITTCIKAGYEYGYSPIGIMIISIIIAIIIQSSAAKLGIITQSSMSQNIQVNNNSLMHRFLSMLLVVFPIFISCSAFESGNITGTVIALNGIIGNCPSWVYIIIVSLSVFFVLWNDKYRIIERVLRIMVFVMAICFVLSVLIIHPDWVQVFWKLFDLNLFKNNTLIIGALLGTTIGAYNIFLHSELAAKQWHKASDIKHMVFDTILSIGIGGIISCCIIIVAGTVVNKMEITELSIENFATILTDPLGNFGQAVFYIGLFAAGLTSAITAPLAASYTITGVMFKEDDKRSRLVKSLIWLSVLLIGTAFSLILGRSPQELIIIVQVINAIILPLIMFYLLKALNSKQMGAYKNGLIENIILIIMLLICSLIGGENIYQIFV